MTRLLALSTALLIVGFSSAAFADKHLSAKAEGNTVTIFTTTKKPMACEAVVRFTYLAAGKREKGWTSCGFFTSKPGKLVEACHFTNEQIIEPQLDGDVQGNCKDQPAPAPQ